MKIVAPRAMLQLALFTSSLLCAASGLGATVYVRTDGSDAACTGLANKKYPGSGSGVACAKRTIQAGVSAAAPGDVVAVATGTYRENVTVDRSITLQGAGKGTVVEPAFSDPNCGGMGGGSLCAGSSNVILVQADGVTITDLTVDGDNPTLTSGVVAGGADLDARNGIITDHRLGTFEDLTVAHVTVRNLYLRGLYASSGGTFDFHDDEVTNVQASPASVAMFNFGGSGRMADNKVSYANDAISSNHSSGVELTGNEVSHSGSGVHTDNAGDGGGTADVLAGNTVKDCLANGYGVWTFVSYLPPAVHDNTVEHCAVGFAAFGNGAPITVPFTDNTAKGDGTPGGVGFYVTTTDIGFGPFDVSVSLTRDAASTFETGFYVQEDGGKQAVATLDACDASKDGTGVDADAAQVDVTRTCVQDNATGVLDHDEAALTVHTSAIKGNADFGVDNTSLAGADATGNWWGNASGPNPPGKGDRVSGNVAVVPFATKALKCGPKLKDAQSFAGDEVEAVATTDAPRFAPRSGRLAVPAPPSATAVR